jgi:hypothetical protein
VPEDHYQAEVGFGENLRVTIRQIVHERGPLFYCEDLEYSHESFQNVIVRINAILDVWIIVDPIILQADSVLNGTPAVKSGGTLKITITSRAAYSGVDLTLGPICSI